MIFKQRRYQNSQRKFLILFMTLEEYWNYTTSYFFWFKNYLPEASINDGFDTIFGTSGWNATSFYKILILLLRYFFLFDEQKKNRVNWKSSWNNSMYRKIIQEEVNSIAVEMPRIQSDLFIHRSSYYLQNRFCKNLTMPINTVIYVHTDGHWFYIRAVIFHHSNNS